jgi:hypothetical protein
MFELCSISCRPRDLSRGRRRHLGVVSVVS